MVQIKNVKLRKKKQLQQKNSLQWKRGIMKGQIIKIVSDLHVVSSNGKNYDCKCRGKFRKDKIVPKVGDYVFFNPEQKVIEEILPRKNCFQRPSVANIDQAFLITSLRLPDFSFNLLDKLIVLMELHSVEPIICITKSDLLSKDELDKIDSYLAYYKKIGYQVIYNTEIEYIKSLLRKKTSVFTGQTGAGKSTLLNKLNSNWNLKTGDVSIALGRGRHTTRVVELFEINEGKVLDTPGFSALDFYEYNNEDIRNSFIEFHDYPCIYKDCMHKNEKECQVKLAVDNNNIMKSRYENYLKFIERK